MAKQNFNYEKRQKEMAKKKKKEEKKQKKLDKAAAGPQVTENDESGFEPEVDSDSDGDEENGEEE